MILEWPQITMIVLTLIGFGIVSHKHGQPQPKYNVWKWMLSAVTQWFLLYMGGFLG